MPRNTPDKTLIDPPSGTVVQVRPGEVQALVFNFRNEAPLNAAFHMEVEGLPGPTWYSGAGTEDAAIAPAFGEGALSLSIHPPMQAVGGSHTLHVRIVSDMGAIAGADTFDLAVEVVAPEGGWGESTVVMTRLAEPLIVEVPAATYNDSPLPSLASLPGPESVQPPSEARMAAVTPPVATPPVATPPVATPPVATPPVAKSPAPTGTGVGSTPPTPIPPSAPPVIPTRPAPVPEPRESKSLIAPPPAPVVTPPPPPPAPVARPAAQTPPPVVQTPPAAAPVEPLQVVDFTPPAAAAPVWGARQPEAQEAESPAEPTERNQRDPAEGTTLTIEPGGTLLLRFSFTNAGRRDQTYILEEDRSLPSDWVTLTRDQVNLTANGSGEVIMRLLPPLNAEPGSYPFQVRIGPLGGALQTRTLTLSIPATPAVKLSAKETNRKVGPFHINSIPFSLSVERAGNADTAFRVLLLPPSDAASTVPPPKTAVGSSAAPASPPTYQHDRWYFLLNRELGNLESPAYGRMPPPQEVQLEVVPRGMWWFGFQQSVRVQVEVVPVTDPRNGGKRDNSVELTATRYRILPFPAFLLIPLVLLITPFLFFGASDLRVTNGYASEVGGKYFYILGNKDAKELTAQLAWDGPSFVPFTVQADERSLPFKFGKASDSFTPASGDYFKERHYTIRGASPIVARFVPYKTENKLQIKSGALMLRATARDKEAFGPAKVTAKNAVFRLSVPRTGQPVPISFVNMTSQASAATIKIFLVKEPQSGAYELLDQKNDREATAGGAPTSPIKVKYRGSSSKDSTTEDELIFATTDGANQIVHIKLTP